MSGPSVTADRVRTAVVLCAHDGAAFIAEQLDSIERQNLPVDELHVFDWNSGDATLTRVRQWAGRNERRAATTCVHAMTSAPGPARSFLHAIKHVIRASRADLILLSDQDDLWSPEKVSTLVGEYDRAPFDVAFSDVRVLRQSDGAVVPSFYGRGSPYRRPRSAFDPTIVLTNPVIGMTMCLRRDWLLRVQDTFELYWIMHDWALAILCWLTSGRVRYVDLPLVAYRQHASNALGAWADRSLLSRAASVSTHVRNVQQQLESARRAGRALEAASDRQAQLARLQGRAALARAALGSTLLSARYRMLLSASFFCFG